MHRNAQASHDQRELSERVARAALVPILDPVAASHSPEVHEVLGMERPDGCRKWGPNDVGEIHRQIRAQGLEHVRAVVRFLHAAIEARRTFGQWETQPRDWASLWQHDGSPWCRWDQRYAEATSDTAQATADETDRSWIEKPWEQIEAEVKAARPDTADYELCCKRVKWDIHHNPMPPPPEFE